MNESLHLKFWRHSVAGISGPYLSEEEIGLIKEYPPAGIILFARNVEDARQLRKLTSELSGINPDLLIMADHEGGMISVLADGAGVPPSQFAMGRVESGELRREVYRETASRMRCLGVDTLLGPLADINSNPENPVIGTRAFPGSAGEVGRLVAEEVEEFRRAGLLTCLKHFPGHGGTGTDSHLALPEAPGLSTENGRIAAIPFRNGIEAGADMVMTGHLEVGESGIPSSLDRPVIDYLRSALGFEGVVITDD
ncbi:MAG: hypothetical protein GF417_10445, partial [Candidatus Latescibacteria bacterium]|nr:hypothetical protein [bacterium]MBD3424846.1 hypothetical protein [Candidatus Latescibacterota bacterium]